MNAPPVSVIVVTKNEEKRITQCLEALRVFDDVWVVDSGSEDATQALAEKAGARVVNFDWNGRYPKKRQWCLNALELAHDWVFFVDADEIVTPELVEEIRGLDFRAAGYFVRGRYVFEGKVLRFGLANNKLCLIDRRRMEFPVVDDLDLPGMGEMEGHYQPILKQYSTMPGEYCNQSQSYQKIHQLKGFILHNAFEGGAGVWMTGGVRSVGNEKSAGAQGCGSDNRSGDYKSVMREEVSGWAQRHEQYAAWERGMNARGAWPEDARLMKRVFKALPFQPLLAFAHSYVLKLGFLDGAAGFRFAKTRWRYYRMI